MRLLSDFTFPLPPPSFYSQGNQLSEPMTEFVHGESGEANGMIYAATGMQGWRRDMEDRHLLVGSIPGADDHALFAVFDGHGGQEAADFAADNLQQALVKSAAFVQYAQGARDDVALLQQALEASLLTCDADLRATLPPDCRAGCTSVVAVVTPTHIICANRLALVSDPACL